MIGGGPVGLALAGDLGWRGISCVLIEQSDGSIYQPRMDLVGVRTMEFCRRWGFVAGGRSFALPARLRAGQYLSDQSHGLRARTRTLSRHRPGAAAEGKPAASRTLPAKHVRPDLARIRGVAKNGRDALSHAAYLVHADRRSRDRRQSRMPRPARAKILSRVTSSAATAPAAWCARRSASRCTARRC